MAQGSVIKGIVLLAVGAMWVTALALLLHRPRDPVQDWDLAELIDRADRLVVTQRRGRELSVIYESSKRSDLEALKDSLRVEQPEKLLHCMCLGSQAIALYDGDDQIGRITNHHAKQIRCSLWRSDARLVDVEAFLKWFDDRNMPVPRKDHEERLERDREWQRNKRKWVDAMPASLKPLWETVTRSFEPKFNPLREALAEEIPEKGARILALFAWFGSGAGPWSGYPAYEDIAEKLLLDYPTRELLAAVESRKLTETQTEGVARFFAGYFFLHLRAEERSLLSAELKARLLEHSLSSADEDKRGRAQRAFGGQ